MSLLCLADAPPHAVLGAFLQQPCGAAGVVSDAQHDRRSVDASALSDRVEQLGIAALNVACQRAESRLLEVC